MRIVFFLWIFIIFSTTVCANEAKSPLKVGILVYNGIYLLDFAGPLEIFNDTYLDDTTKGFEVILIAPDTNDIQAHTGHYFKSNCHIANCPHLDILVVPGGNLSLTKELPEVADFIKSRATSSKIIMSVCTGAFILADLGLLDNLEATTWYGAKKRLQKLYPNIKIVDKRFTDNGKIITTAGVSAGIDGALHIVERIYGKQIADKTAKYIEWE